MRDILLVEVEKLITQRESMIAENRHCDITQEYIPYSEAFFEPIIKRLDEIVLTLKNLPE